MLCNLLFIIVILLSLWRTEIIKIAHVKLHVEYSAFKVIVQKHLFVQIGHSMVCSTLINIEINRDLTKKIEKFWITLVYFFSLHASHRFYGWRSKKLNWWRSQLHVVDKLACCKYSGWIGPLLEFCFWFKTATWRVTCQIF